jgi:hypothetical protein
VNIEKRLERLERWIPVWHEVLTLVRNDLITVSESLRSFRTHLKAFEGVTSTKTDALHELIKQVNQYTALLDTKVTSIATIFCREFNIDPDDFIAEYRKTLTDLRTGNADINKLIEDTMSDPEES